MIQYDPHKWLDHFFDIRGSLLREISVRVASCGVFSVGVVLFHHLVRPVDIPSTAHVMVGTALGLLLVFRTNASYDRFWEGRRLWGGIVNETRNLVRAGSVQLHSEPELLKSLTRWTAIFPWAVMAVLRDQSVIGPLVQELPQEDRALVESSQHPALYVAQRISLCLKGASRRGLITDIIEMALDQNVQQLVGYLGGCERIRKTPLPFAYVVHLRRVLVVYCFTLPFALVDSYGWPTVAVVALVAYTFFGIEEIGVEIEGPFGNDENDLPLEAICETIHHNTYALAGIGSQQRDTMPPGL